jgi:hypothetical protein
VHKEIRQNRMALQVAGILGSEGQRTFEANCRDRMRHLGWELQGRKRGVQVEGEAHGMRRKMARSSWRALGC